MPAEAGRESIPPLCLPLSKGEIEWGFWIFVFAGMTQSE
jgi:hypothetical protein